MRRRMMTVYLTLLVLTCLGLAIPLCVTLAERATTVVVLDRTADATRFASLAEQAVVTGQSGSVDGELVAYQQIYGIDTVVLNREGGLVARARPGLALHTLLDPEGRHPETDALDPVQAALVGTRSTTAQPIWPWSTGPLVVAEPVSSGGEIVGVVVTSSPTDSVRRGLTVQWAVVLAGVLAVILLGTAAAGPLTRWVLRPVADLEGAVRQLARGRLGTRVRVEGPDELQHLATAFNTMAATLTTLLERQRTFVAYAGHQIRNPLAALRLRVEALATQLPMEGREPHQLALDELDRLSRTCDGLLTLARADEERLPAEEVDARAVVQDRLRAWWPIAERSGASFDVDVPEGLVVRTIEGSLDQALDVLLDNALKFGGEGVHVGVTARQDAGTGAVTVEVVDDGPGLPAEQLARATQPFWQAARTRDEVAGGAGGTGLGLSIVVTLLDLDDGRLQLMPAQPHGVRAVISLPDPRRDRP